MNEFKLRRLDGEYYADSREVAESIDKKHCDLLRSIKSYCAILTESKIALSDFFVPAEYEDGTGRKLPCYLITKKGCDMIANKLTGKKGVLFTAKYVSAFEEMRSRLESGQASDTPVNGISALIKNVRVVMEKQRSNPRKIAGQTELILRHYGIPVVKDFVEPGSWEQLTLAELEVKQ